ncbi:Inositol-1 [Diplonema papillatum]|nr:Inositol-1 [Diplonema papillatum]|eukprot:gene23040-35306_t
MPSLFGWIGFRRNKTTEKKDADRNAGSDGRAGSSVSADDQSASGLKLEEEIEETAERLQESKDALRAAANAVLQDESKFPKFVEPRTLRFAICTFNVGEKLPRSTPDYIDWLRATSKTLPHVIAVGIQEVDMSPGTVLLEGVSQKTFVWEAFLTRALGSMADAANEGGYVRVASVDLAGLLLLVFAHESVASECSNVSTSRVRVGQSGFGNKGAVAMRMTCCGRKVLLLNAHLEAHTERVHLRNKGYERILSEMKFSSDGVGPEDPLDLMWPSHPASDYEAPLDMLPVELLTLFSSTQGSFDAIETEAGSPKLTRSPTSSLMPPRASTEDCNDSAATMASVMGRRKAGSAPVLDTEEVHGSNPVISGFDYVFWFGDLNYRIWHVANHVIREMIRQNKLDLLLDHDQLNQNLSTSSAFAGFSECPITFPPTYKYDIGTDAYDSSAKSRAPSWTDRVLFLAHAAASYPPPQMLPPPEIETSSAVQAGRLSDAYSSALPMYSIAEEAYFSTAREKPYLASFHSCQESFFHGHMQKGLRTVSEMLDKQTLARASSFKPSSVSPGGKPRAGFHPGAAGTNANTGIIPIQNALDSTVAQTHSPPVGQLPFPAAAAGASDRNFAGGGVTSPRVYTPLGGPHAGTAASPAPALPQNAASPSMHSASNSPETLPPLPRPGGQAHPAAAVAGGVPVFGAHTTSEPSSPGGHVHSPETPGGGLLQAQSYASLKSALGATNAFSLSGSGVGGWSAAHADEKPPDDRDGNRALRPKGINPHTQHPHDDDDASICNIQSPAPQLSSGQMYLHSAGTTQASSIAASVSPQNKSTSSNLLSGTQPISKLASVPVGTATSSSTMSPPLHPSHLTKRDGGVNMPGTSVHSTGSAPISPVNSCLDVSMRTGYTGSAGNLHVSAYRQQLYAQGNPSAAILHGLGSHGEIPLCTSPGQGGAEDSFHTGALPSQAAGGYPAVPASHANHVSSQRTMVMHSALQQNSSHTASVAAASCMSAYPLLGEVPMTKSAPLVEETQGSLIANMALPPSTYNAGDLLCIDLDASQALDIDWTFEKCAVHVSAVREGSPSWQKGLRPGMRLVSMNGISPVNVQVVHLLLGGRDTLPTVFARNDDEDSDLLRPCQPALANHLTHLNELCPVLGSYSAHPIRLSDHRPVSALFDLKATSFNRAAAARAIQEDPGVLAVASRIAELEGKLAGLRQQQYSKR